MGDAAGLNHVVLVGQLLKAPQLRHSPAGVPIARLWIEHRSNQKEGGRERAVALRIEVRLTGEPLRRQLQGLEIGQRLRVRGHLARPDRRGEPSRLIVVAEALERLDRTT